MHQPRRDEGGETRGGGGGGGGGGRGEEGDGDGEMRGTGEISH